MTEKAGTLRIDMPNTARLIDELRQAFGKDYVDALLLRAKRGQGGFYAAELSPVSGELKTFGSTSRYGRGPDGRKAAVIDGQVVIPDERTKRGA